MAISNIITGISVVAGAGATADIRPAAGVEYKVIDFGSQHAFVANVPDLQVAINDGVNPACVVLVDPTTDPGKRTRQFEFYITHDNYITLTNTGGAGANLSIIGELIRPGLTITDVALIGGGLQYDIRPPAGQTWKITELGCDVWTAGPADINPNIRVFLTDGVTLLPIVLDPTMVRGQDKQLEIYIDHDIYLSVLDVGGVGCTIAWCGRRVPLTTINSVQDVGIGGTLDIQPPAGQEWVVTELAAETWAGGGAPNDYPDVNVSIMVGANLSDILEAGSVATSLRWNTPFNFKIDNTHFIRITNINAAANEVGVVGYAQRAY